MVKAVTSSAEIIPTYLTFGFVFFVYFVLRDIWTLVLFRCFTIFLFFTHIYHGGGYGIPIYNLQNKIYGQDIYRDNKSKSSIQRFIKRTHFAVKIAAIHY